MVSLALAPSTTGAVLTCNSGLSRAAVAGVAVFDGCLLSVADPGAVIVASATGLTPASSAPFAVAAAGPASTAPAPLLTIDAAGTPTLWGMDVRLATALVPPGTEPANGRILHLERSADGVHWTPSSDLATDAAGFAGALERPATNTWYRVTFDGAPDLAPATSPAVKVLVPRVALLRPDSKGVVRRVPRGTAVSFATFVRPTPPSAAAGRVEYRLVQRVGRTWVVRRSWSATVDSRGWARLRITFASSGSLERPGQGARDRSELDKRVVDRPAVRRSVGVAWATQHARAEGARRADVTPARPAAMRVAATASGR